MRRLVLIVSLAGVGLLGGVGGVSAGRTPERARAASTIRLIVVHAADGETAALAPVVIHGHVFPFLIDTGATRSVVDLALARRLGLTRIAGANGHAFGLLGSDVLSRFGSAKLDYARSRLVLG